jgi:hypothetical protein
VSSLYVITNEALFRIENIQKSLKKFLIVPVRNVYLSHFCCRSIIRERFARKGLTVNNFDYHLLLFAHSHV